MKQNAQKIVKDTLTSIRDRSVFFENINREAEICARNNSLLGVLIVSILNFRDITTALGYETGDTLLSLFYQRLQDILKQNDIIAHLRDNEFALILPNLRNIGHVKLAANKIMRVVNEPFKAGDQILKIRTAVGISVFPKTTDKPKILLQQADMALSQAISSNVPFVFFPDRDDDKPTPSFVIEAELEAALQDNELFLNYQPKVDLKSGSVSGVEVLARWQHPQKGLISPEIFIPIAERSGLIVPLTLWVLNVAMRQFGEWPNKGNLTIAINLSANTLHDPTLLDVIKRTMNIWGIPASTLVLEITESAMMSDPEHSLETLQQLQDMGISISIDDFGTGYSSLAYLNKLPVTELKIDKSFIKNMLVNRNDEMIVRSILDLAHNFGIVVTAEGIEDQATYNKLQDMNCEYAQGFYMGRPMPSSEIIRWLQESPWSKKSEN